MNLSCNFSQKIFAKSDLIKKICFYLFFSWLVTLNISPIAVFVSKIYPYSAILVSVSCLFAILLNIFEKRKIFIYDKLLILFLAISTISCFFNRDGIPENLKRVIWCSIYLLFIFSDDSLAKYVKNVKLIFSVIIFSLSLISVSMFFINYKIFFPLRDEWIHIGFIDNRLFGAYMDPNYASILSMLSAFFCIENIYNKKHIIPSVVNIVIQIFYMSLANSRTCYASLLGSLLFILFFAFCRKFKGKFKKASNLILSSIMSIVCAIICLFAVNLTAIQLANTVNFLNSFNSGDSKKIEMRLNRVDIEKNHDYSNGRLRIWQDSLNVLKKTCFIGASPGNIKNYAKKHFPNGIIATKNYYAMHNVLVDTFVSVGIFGGLVFVIFMFKYAILIFSKYLKNAICNMNSDFEFDIIIASILAVLISSMFLSDIMFFNKLGAFFFWLFLGKIRRKLGDK